MIDLGPGERLLVIGLNAVEAMHWSREQGYQLRQVILLCRSSQLQGLPRGIRYVLVGQWADRGDRSDVECMLVARRAQRVW